MYVMKLSRSGGSEGDKMGEIYETYKRAENQGGGVTYTIHISIISFWKKRLQLKNKLYICLILFIKIPIFTLPTLSPEGQ